MKLAVLVVGTAANQETTLAITDTKFYVPVVILSTKDNVKPLKQLESSLKRINYWNKCQSNVTQEIRYKHLDFLTDPAFQGVNRLFVLSFDYGRVREIYKEYFLPTVEIKDYNANVNY